MGRKPCCDKVGLKRGPWTIEEDHKLINFIINNGIQCWRAIPKLAGLLRCGKSCRLRWINYLRPDLKRGMLSEMEENQIIQLHSLLGNRWSKIASHFPGRTDNEIKNHWNTRIKKRLKLVGVDPATHKPIEHEENIDRMAESISAKKQEEIREAKSTDNNGQREVAETDEKKNDMLYGTANLLTNNASTSFSPSFSLEESMNPSMVESSSIQEDSLQQWVDSVDSMLSWDAFNQLEDDLFFLRNGQ